MTELRFAPAALVVWAVMLGPDLPVLALAVAVALAFRQPGQALMVLGAGLAAVLRGDAPAPAWEADWGFAAHFAADAPAHTRGLLRGLVLGDTSLQTETEKRVYQVTGLSHLSAVSGANISLVTSAAAIVLRPAGPRLQIAGSLAALVAYACLVGPEPSVLRASVTGVVGLLAVLNSARMQPAHALSLGVLGLLLWDASLARSFGFALSVAATAGIVALHPLIYRALTPLRLPEVLARALAVSIAADCSTMPLVALMTGKVSLVAVLANVIVAPAVAPATILGCLAVLAPPLLVLAQPFTWWIFHVAHGCATLGLGTVEATPLGVAVAYGWIGLGLRYRPRATASVVCALAIAIAWRPPLPPVTGGGIVMLEEGPPHKRPVRTPGGTPVLYPNRDGPVTVHADGRQCSALGWWPCH